MSVCEMCGRSTQLIKADVEGVELTVCGTCSRYGKVKKETLSSVVRRSFVKKSKNEELKVVGNFSSLIRKSRERSGLNQEDFAKKLNERVSILAKWEQGVLQPNLAVARKLKRILGLNLLEQDVSNPVDYKPTNKKMELTLGDFVKVRKRK